jgi:AhpD family alkylhydroperoxidase
MGDCPRLGSRFRDLVVTAGALPRPRSMIVSPLYPTRGALVKQRLNYAKAAPGVYDAMDVLDRYLQECGLERPLLLLIQLRASQINGCAYCLDMHWKDLRSIGETEQRLYSLDAWRECPYYTGRERAGLAWVEAVTSITDGRVPDAVHEQVRSHFSEKELADLTLAAATINAWNRLSISARLVPGGYQPTAAAS